MDDISWIVELVYYPSSDCLVAACLREGEDAYLDESTMVIITTPLERDLLTAGVGGHDGGGGAALVGGAVGVNRVLTRLGLFSWNREGQVSSEGGGEGEGGGVLTAIKMVWQEALETIARRLRAVFILGRGILVLYLVPPSLIGVEQIL